MLASRTEHKRENRAGGENIDRGWVQRWKSYKIRAQVSNTHGLHPT